MHMRALLVLIFALLLAADQNKDDATKKEYQKFEGTWIFESIEVEGNKVPTEDVKSKLICKGNEFTLQSAEATYKGTFKVDISKKPKQIDVLFSEGPEKGKTSLGIYELEGDTYKVCIGLADNQNRPTEFVSKPGSGHVLEVLKRQK